VITTDQPQQPQYQTQSPQPQYQTLKPGQSRRRQYQTVKPAQPLQPLQQRQQQPPQQQPLQQRQQQPLQQQYQQQRQQQPLQQQYQQQRQQQPLQQQYQEQQYQAAPPEEPPEEPPQKKKKAGKIILAILIILVIIASAGFLYLRPALETPPDMRANRRGPERIQVTGGGGLFGSVGNLIDSSVRDTSKYTFLVLETDQGEANTDVIMVVTFDTANYTFDIVNIPRDTLVNVGWPTKKANSIFANMRYQNREEDNSEAKTMADTISRFAEITGYEVDYWARVDMKAFVSLIDAIGGVDFDVPVDMNYEDSYQDLSIHYTKGVHHLSGQQALEVLRFRSGYSSGDIGRIGTQQSFLKSAAEQILEKRNSINITTLAGVAISDVKTDMKLSDMIWFGRQFLKMDAENVNFHMLPGNAENVAGQSYVTIKTDEWLEMVNDIFSPFHDDITPEDVSILTRGANKKFYVTDGNWRANQGWPN